MCIKGIVNKDSDMMYAGNISGNNAGEVWVDDVSNPAFCVVWSKFLEGFHFMGSPYSQIGKPRLRAFVEDIIIPFLKDKEMSCCEFSCDSQELIPFVFDVLSNYKIDRGKQYVYRLHDKNNINTNIPCPEGYDIFEINERFINKELLSVDNRDAIYTDIEKAWGSVERFIQRGKGYAAIQNNRICSFATTHFRYKDIYSIGTETFEPYKQKGLSSFLSMSLIKNLASQCADIWWDCMESNIASQRTAIKTGLTFDHEYEVFWFNI